MQHTAEALEALIARIPGFDEGARAAAAAALDAKTKPRGSLGRLESLAAQIAGIRGVAAPGALEAAVVLIAADHGIAAEGTSAYPQAVTHQMLANFAAGGAAICVLARQAGARLVVVDAGVVEPFVHPDVLDRRIGAGTANAARGPAMTRVQATASLLAGVAIADELIAQGVGLIALGEMGIANSAIAAALTAVFTGADPAAVCGRGTGVDDEGLARKVVAVSAALVVNRPDRHDPEGVLAAVGGFELGMLAGVMIGAATRRVPVVLDGFITTAAALVAVAIAPSARDALIASHRSVEPGHAVALAALGLDPLLDLELRLGEASGAALALPIVHASLAILAEMATFADAGVTDTGA